MTTEPGSAFVDPDPLRGPIPPLPPANEPLPDTGNVSEADYKGTGKTSVRTRYPYRFAPSDKNIPVVDRRGVKVTRDQADTLVNESNGLVYIYKEEE